MASSDPVWEIPTSLDEATERADILLRDIDRIQVQLGNRNVTTETGERLEGRAYWTWRHRALFARTAKLTEYRFLKKWLSEHRRKERSSVVEAARELLSLGLLEALPPGPLLAAAVALQRAVSSEHIGSNEPATPEDSDVDPLNR